MPAQPEQRLAFDQQIRALTIELEKAAPAALPTGMGALNPVARRGVAGSGRAGDLTR